MADTSSSSPSSTDSRSTIILAVSWTETFIGLTFFFLRFITNWKIVSRFRWDFFVATLTVTTQVIAQIFLQLSVHHGMGRHIRTLSHESEVQTLKWSWVFQLLAIAGSMLGKLAILAFLMQIRGRHEKKPWLLIILGILIATINIAVLGTILGQCVPMAKLWDDSLPGTCDPGRKNNQNYSFFQASFNSFSDALLATYPVHLFWKLQMKLRIKVALSVLMGLGWIAAVCSAVKTYELKALTETSDITWAQPSLLIWASTEAWIVIVVGCVPPIRPLMERILVRLGLSSKKTSTPRYGYYEYDSSRPGYGNRSALGTGHGTGTGTGNHSQFKADAYGGNNAKKGFSTNTGAVDDELDWIEMGNAGHGTGQHGNGSKERIVPVGGGVNDVVITTDIVTRFEDAGGHGHGHTGMRSGSAASGSSSSGEDLERRQSASGKVL
ncbi:uncharacterized protein BDV14DRAFT_199892 [Aspergillus stella-maris]|uniref:uncharacterized protein n=1 Tax=Aspergillus stella-maris TaxID=1810926 RepID=UPI003CCD00E1